MSVYGWFCCIDCGTCLWLGKSISVETNNGWRLDQFHRGSTEEPPNWAREKLNRVIWRMLADHQGHCLRVLLDDEFEKLAETVEIREIGGESIGDTDINDYIGGGRGFRPGNRVEGKGADEGLLASDSETLGCEGSRRGAYSGKWPPAERIGVHPDGPTFLQRCSVCGSYWELALRTARPITEKEARELYPGEFESQ